MDDNDTMILRVEGGPEADDLEVARLTKQLRQRLLELDVHRADPVREANIPYGAKPGDAIVLGALLVTLAPTALAGVVDLLKSWIGTSRARSVEISVHGRSIKLTNASRTDTDQLIKEFLRPDLRD